MTASRLQPLVLERMEWSESATQTGSPAMSDTTNPAVPQAARRYPPPRQKVPAFARFEGTSAWRKYHRRAREYARFQAAAKQVKQAVGAPGS